MDLLSQVRRRYAELLSISISSYRDYLSLRKELLTAIVGLAISTAASIAISLFTWMPHSVEMSIVVMIIGSILSLHDVLARISRSLERSRGLAEELPYLVFMASAVAKTGLELIEAMRFISSSETQVFRFFKSLSTRLLNASRYVGVEEALERLAGIPRGVRRVLVSYLSSISMGTGVETLNTLSLEMIREASKNASRSIDLAAQAGLVAIMVLTTAPILILGVSSILGSYVALSSGIMISLFTPLAVLSIPQTPLPLRLIVSGDRRRYFLILSVVSMGLIASLYVSIYLLALSIIRIDILKIPLVVLSIAMISTGSLWLAVFTGYLAGVRRARDILSSASSYVKAYRTLNGYDPDKEEFNTPPYAPWILHYVTLSIRFFKEKGEIEPIVFTRFSEEVIDIIAKNTNRIVGSSLPLAASLAQPIMLSQMIPMLGSIAHSVGTVVILIASIAASSLIASKIFFNTARNTLVMGLSLLLLYTLILR